MFLESPNKISEIINAKVNQLKGKRTQIDIAEAAGIHLSHFSAMKRGEKQINTHHLHKIAIGLDAYPSDLLPASWIREESKTDAARIEKAIAVVISAYIENMEEHGKDYITPEELAKIATVLVEDAGAKLDKVTLNNTIKIAKRIKEI